MTGYSKYRVHLLHNSVHKMQKENRQSSGRYAGERRPRPQFLYIAYSRSALYGVQTIFVGSTCARRQLSVASTCW